MRRFAAFALLLSLLFSLCACRSSLSQSDEDTTILSDTLRESVELPEITAEEVMLSYPVDEPWTLTNGEGETLRYEGNNQFSGSIEILETYPPGYTGYPPTHLQIRIPASNSFTFRLDEPGKTAHTGFTVYDLIQDDADHELYGVAEGSGISTVVIDTLGVEVRGENMNCKAYSREYSQSWMFSLEAAAASYMSIFAQPGSTEAVLDTDGGNTDVWIEHQYMLTEPRNISATEGMPLKLTNLQAEDITLIEAEPYED